MINRSLRFGLIVLGLVILSVSVGPYAFNYFQPTAGVVLLSAEAGENIPPAFSGNRGAYGFALFSLFTMTTLSMRKIIVVACCMAREGGGALLDVTLHRLAIICLLAVILLGTAPEVALLLLWGEISLDGHVALMSLDRLGDGLTIIPYLLFLAFMLKAEQLDAHEGILGRTEKPRGRKVRFFELLPTRDILKEQGVIVGGVLAIALGLSLFK